MKLAGFAWECNCGHIEYDEEDPQECSMCNALSSFVKIPGEILEEREHDMPEDNLIPSIYPIKKSAARTKNSRRKSK